MTNHENIARIKNDLEAMSGKIEETAPEWWQGDKICQISTSFSSLQELDKGIKASLDTMLAELARHLDENRREPKSMTIFKEVIGGMYLLIVGVEWEDRKG